MAHIKGALIASLLAGIIPGGAVAVAFADAALALQVAPVCAALMFAVARPRRRGVL